MSTSWTGNGIRSEDTRPECESERLTSAGSITQVVQTAQSEQVLELVDSGCIISRKDLVDVGDPCSDVCRAVS